MTTSATSSEPQSQALSCLEVWGGNEPVDVGLKVPGLDVWVYAQPFENAAAGGDVHFVSSCGSGRIARLMVADVAGHGQAVAETARTLRGLIRRFMNHIDQRKLVMSMNEKFTELAEAGRFATAVVMTYFSPDGSLSVCNAGHPPPLIYRSATSTWQYLDASAAAGDADQGGNIPLGIVADVGYQQFDVRLESGDLMLCYTDSLVEARCPDGSLLGADGLLEAARGVGVSEPPRVLRGLLTALATRGARLDDDVTMLLARCSAHVGGAPFFSKLLGELKFVAQVLTFRRNVPWPEWTLKNVGGMLFPRLSNTKRR